MKRIIFPFAAFVFAARAIFEAPMTLLFAIIAFCAWAYLAIFRGAFWRADQRLGVAPSPALWPSIAAVIPARNEGATIEAVIGAHMNTDYAGDFSVFLVDDQSSDDTKNLAAKAALENPSRLTLIDGSPLPGGWSGKVWAMHQGLTAAKETAPEYFLLTDADIQFAPETLARLVAKAEADDLSLVSLMARLDTRGLWGGLLIPAFIYFFQKLYPFPLSNDPNENVACAAGGCMLVRASALLNAGGVAAIRNDLIDDCALARRVKDLSPTTKTWIGLAGSEAVSLRDNRTLSSVWNMVARTAYAQLQYSPLLLAGSVLGMAVIYLGPPLLALGLVVHGNILATLIAIFAWAVMAFTYWPTLRHYGQQPWQAVTLPIAAILYSLMTVHSGFRHMGGRGGQWKGRHYDLGKTS